MPQRVKIKTQEVSTMTSQTIISPQKENFLHLGEQTRKNTRFRIEKNLIL